MQKFDDLKFGSLILASEQASALPLEHTAVSAQVSGPIASVSVTQTFSNPFKEPIELTYLFPLPHEAAIVDYEIAIGSRVIRAEMKELQAAREAYQKAIDAGQRASLLEQHRPNLFSIQIGNVQPAESIRTTLRYQERLRYDDDHYTFVFPMGVTPKYHANPAEAPNVDSPVAMPGERIGGVSLSLSIDAGVSVGDPSSPSHAITLARQDERRFMVNLPDGTIPNKDFVLRYTVATDALQSASWVSADGDNSDTVLITLLPPRLNTNIPPEPREFVFIIDRSGSMGGEPIEAARNALKACLRAMSERDTFMLQAFDDQIEWFSKSAQPVTQATVQRADKWIDTVEGRGGTEIVPAIQAALSIPPDKTRQRLIVFLTDGAVSAEESVYDELKKKRGDSRIFTFGIGSSVNRALLSKMAEVGRGTAEFLQLNEDIETTITRFQDRVSYPALLDIQVKWKDAQTWDTYPVVLPDLYVGQPLELVTRLKRTGGAALPVVLMLSGKRSGQPVSMSITIPTTTTSDPALQRVWARARVDSLTDQAMSDDKVRQQIISLAIDHRLLTPYTAFVAVDSEMANASGDSARKVNVAIPLPESVDFGRMSGFSGGGAMIGAGMMLGSAAPPAAAPPSPLSVTSMSRARKVAPPPPPGISSSEDFDDIPFDASSTFDYSPVSEPTPDWLSSFSAPQSPAPSPEPTFADIAERIKWLARTQNLSGSWGSGAHEAEQTAVALIAFVRAGHTTRTGNYRRQVRKAADWLKGATISGLAAYLRFRALSELDSATGHADHEVTDALKVGAASNDVERAALSDPSVAVPTTVQTLDDLRIVALSVGAASAPAALLKDAAQANLIETWLAVGKSIL